MKLLRFGLAWILTVLFFSFTDYQTLSAQTVWYVDASATGSNNGQSWENAFTNLNGVDRNANPGDQIWVRSGVYSRTGGQSSESAFTIGDGVEIYGGFNGTETDLDQRDWEANPTVLTANFQNTPSDPHNAIEDASDPANLSGFYSRVVRFRVGNSSTAVLDGFIVTGGRNGQGAGVYIPGSMPDEPLSPILRNLHIEGNRSSVNAGYGGGIYAIVNYPQLVENVTLKRNYAYRGGGYAHSIQDDEVGPVFKNVRFIENSAINYPEGDGRTNGGTGGGAQPNGGTFSFEDVVFEGNSAESFGGGIGVLSSMVYTSTGAIRNARFKGNTANGGGAVYVNGLNNTVPLTLSITNTLFYGNTANNLGSAVRTDFASSVTVTNATFTKNISSGGGVFTNATTAAVILNSIFYDNEDGDGFSIFSFSGGVTLSHSLRDANILNVSTSGGNNITGQNPVFVDPDNDIYLLRNSSPARNTGDPNTNLALFPVDENDNPVDLDGAARVQEGQITMGAFETTVGDPPTASDLTIKNTAPVLLASQISDTFSSPDGLQLEIIRITGLPENGTLSAAGSDILTVPAEITAADFSSLQYQPTNPEAFGPLFDSFDFEVGDGLQFSNLSYTTTLGLDEGPEAYRSLSILSGSTPRGAVIPGDEVSHFDFSQPFTIEFWVKAEALNTNPVVFSTLKNDASGGFRIEVGSQLAGDGRVVVTNSPDEFIYLRVSEPDAVPENEWTHIAYVNDGNSEDNRRILVNGEDVSGNFGFAPFAIQNNNDDIEIGWDTRSAAETQFNGNLADLRIWGAALDEEQIRSRMYEYLTGDEEHLLANYIIQRAGGGESVLSTPVGPEAELTSGVRLEGDTFRPHGVRISGSEGWRMLSSPLVDSSYGEILEPIWTQGFTGSDSPEFEFSNVLYWNESAKNYTSIENAAAVPGAGKGFIVYVFDDDNFDGNPDGFPKVLQVHNTPSFGSVSPELSFTNTEELSIDGWNLIGNPFGTTIDWDSENGWTRSNIDATIYIWNAEAGEFQTWNGSGGTLESEGLIAPWQGFLIKTNAPSPSLTISEEAQRPGGSLMRSEPAPRLTFTLENGDLRSSALVMLSGEAETGKDPLDAYKLMSLNSNYLSLFTTLDDGTALEINALPGNLEEPIEIPVYFNGSSLNGTFEMSWEKEALPNNWQFTLYDTYTGDEYDLKDHSGFSFVPESQRVSGGERNPEGTEKQRINPTTPEVIQTSSDADSRFMLSIIPGTAVSTGEPSGLPETVKLDQNYPNPFNPTTMISYRLPEADRVQLQVFDITGRLVSTLVNEQMQAGVHQVQFDASHLASGVYIYRLQTGNTTITRKLTLIK